MQFPKKQSCTAKTAEKYRARRSLEQKTIEQLLSDIQVLCWTFKKFLLKLLPTKTIMYNLIIKVKKNFHVQEIAQIPLTPGWGWAIVRPLACWT